jgi:hypothetical protein
VSLLAILLVFAVLRPEHSAPQFEAMKEATNGVRLI